MFIYSARRPDNLIKKVLTIAQQYHYSVVHYSVNSQDWTNPGPDKIIENVNSHIKGGDIVLSHASDSATQTEEALPAIIHNLKQKRTEKCDRRRPDRKY